MAPNKKDCEGIIRLRISTYQSLQAQSKWLESDVVKCKKELQRRSDAVTKKYDQIAGYTEELILADQEPDPNFLENAEGLYFSLTSQIDSLLDEFAEYDTASEPSVKPAPRICTVSKVKMPKLLSPEFNGKPEDWRSFYQRFEAATRGDEYDDLDRFQYLLAALKNGSDQPIKNLPLLEENYSTALTRLRRRYDNKQLNLRLHLQQLFTLPSVKENDASSLRNLIDVTAANIRALENMNFTRDPLSNELLVQLITSKLDMRTREQWEMQLAKEAAEDKDDDSSEEPEPIDSYSNLMQLLENRLRVVSSVFPNSGTTHPKTSSQKAPTKTTLITTQADSSSRESNRPCSLCSKPHALYRCEEFRKLSVPERYDKVRSLKLCVNCFTPGHWSKDCRSIKCKDCGRSHHTLLHHTTPPKPPPSASNTTAAQASVSTATTSPSNTPSNTTSVASSSTTSSSVLTAVASRPACGVLLATAVVNVRTEFYQGAATVLLDGGSHVSLITRRLQQQLHAPVSAINTSLRGVGNNTMLITQRTNLVIATPDDSFSLEINGFVVDRITEPLPHRSFEIDDTTSWEFLEKYQLADPTFNISKNIDILIGADVLYDILLPEMVKTPYGPILQSSRLGWLLTGPFASPPSTPPVRCHLATQGPVDVPDLTRFWELEDPPSLSKKNLSVQDEMCEKLFQDTHTRMNGRFSVRLPIFDLNLGESYQIARRRISNTKITDEYRTFMEEYEALGHMTRVPDAEMGKAKYYIPHHAIYQKGKIRVVFNASSPTSNGLSLNDGAAPGPTLQAKVFFVLLHFRTHFYQFTTDIVKMYRQIWVHVEDRTWQHILWIISGRIMEFMLNTLTYGFRSAHFLALRSILQLAIDGEKTYPAAAAALRNGSYMDDIEDGADDIETAIQHRDELIALLATAGMSLDKWKANDSHLLPSGSSPTSEPANTLGLLWYTDSDELSIKAPTAATLCTKRSVASYLASIFDPLGFLAPVVVSGKLLLQSIWLANVDWDVPLDNEIQRRFDQFMDHICAATNLHIPRRIFTASPYTFELHGFADASEQAYAACIYTRVTAGDGTISTQLVCSKTRLAPTRTPRTIPELELCAASLLVQLLQPVAEHLQCPLDRCFAYSDSTIVLSYLSKEPRTWKVFVANRVRDILAVVPRSQWRHVPGYQNPADLATRNTSWNDFFSRQELWLNGPDFFKSPHSVEEFTEFDNEALSSAKVAVHVAAVTATSFTPTYDNVVAHLLSRYSEYTRVNKVLVALLRIKDFLLAKIRKIPPPTGEFSVAEFRRAEQLLLREEQRTAFEQEVNCIMANKKLPGKSRLKGLKPFLHSELLRVGGRIARADLPFNSRHPIILPVNHRFMLLLVRHYHYHYFHAGPQFLEDFIRRRFWPIGNLTMLIRKCVNTCARCARFRRNPSIPPSMADLPESRVRPAAPFSQVGVDYAGPFIRKPEIRTRSATQLKTYVAVFVCFVVKAVHLEPVNDLTTAAFLAAFKRFVARRGLPHTIHSDNGTNFTGAAAKLHESFNALAHTTPIQNFATAQQIVWKFNPPAAPHMGGLWEAAVKTMKYHLTRTIGATILTADEFVTVLCQIEAIMNSRPIAPLSPSIPDALTPGHFLIGRPLVAILDDVVERNLALTDRWALVTQILQVFWRRWSHEYLQLLQKRVKWTTPGYTFKVNDVVLIKDESQPPLAWPLGQIIQVYPGKDSIVRVVDVRCRGGSIFRRPVTKLVPLVPTEDTTISTTVDGGGKC